jgi:hypothetical protein
MSQKVKTVAWYTDSERMNRRLEDKRKDEKRADRNKHKRRTVKEEERARQKRGFELGRLVIGKVQGR